MFFRRSVLTFCHNCFQICVGIAANLSQTGWTTNGADEIVNVFSRFFRTRNSYQSVDNSDILLNLSNTFGMQQSPLATPLLY